MHRPFLFWGFKSSHEILESRLGALERAVMGVVWKAGEINVREACELLDSSVAYTTVMTTMDRLFKKRLLARRKVGRAFVYSATATRDEMEGAVATELVQSLLHAVVNERGPPRSPAEAVEIARQAYDRANQLAGTFVPRPQATRQVPSSIANRLNGARPEPRNLKEVVHFALERSRGA
jgi:predicted transcriptional regulator